MKFKTLKAGKYLFYSEVDWKSPDYVQEYRVSAYSPKPIKLDKPRVIKPDMALRYACQELAKVKDCPQIVCN